MNNEHFLKRTNAGISIILCLFLSSCNAGLGPDEEDGFTPFGEVKTVDGRSLHVNVVGEGEPTVLFFSDIDIYGSFINWDIVQKRTGSTTRAISYDRYGYFWSDRGELPRTGERIASETEALLEAEQEGGPFIIVCHAMGGIYGRIFAGRNMNKICGMVLLDPLHPDALERMNEAGIEKAVPDERMRPLIWIMLKLGISKENLQQYGIPDDLFEIAQVYYKKNSLTWFDETAASVESMDQARVYSDFGDIPVHILTSNKTEDPDSDYSKLWVELQRELLDLSNNSQQSILDSVGHYIHLDNPDIVLEAIETMIADYRNVLAVKTRSEDGM